MDVTVGRNSETDCLLLDNCIGREDSLRSGRVTLPGATKSPQAA